MKKVTGPDQSQRIRARAEEVRKRRKAMGLTQMQVATICELSLGTVIGVEVARRDASVLTLAKLAKGLGIKIERLV